MADKQRKLTPEEKKALKSILKVLEPFLDRYKENIERVFNLVRLCKALEKSGPILPEDLDPDIDPEFVTQQTRGDILRAAVVFTHATLEDFLRTLAAKLLPYANEKVLNEVPLSGLNPTGRPEKFFLGKLTSHRGKTIDQVIEESVIDSLDNSNYNNLEDLVRLLTDLEFDVTKIHDLFPEIKDLMNRRHLIVHRVDIGGTMDLRESIIKEITSDDVVRWAESVTNLFSVLVADLGIKLVLTHKAV